MVANMLMVMQTALLTSLCDFSFEPFVSQSHSWISRRRASRICAQAFGHHTWPGIQATAFLGYWGRAARLWTYRFSL